LLAHFSTKNADKHFFRGWIEGRECAGHGSTTQGILLANAIFSNLSPTDHAIQQAEPHHVRHFLTERAPSFGRSTLPIGIPQQYPKVF
jgi:hypothetical protein